MSVSRRILTSLPVDFDVGAGVLAVDHFVADRDRELAAAAAVEQLAGADRRRPCRAAAFPWRCRAARCRRRCVSSASSGSTTTRSSSGRKFDFGHDWIPLCLKLLCSLNVRFESDVSRPTRASLQVELRPCDLHHATHAAHATHASHAAAHSAHATHAVVVIVAAGRLLRPSGFR